MKNKHNPRDADWKGALRRSFRLFHFRFEFGRWRYKTDCCGKTRQMWWEWETSLFGKGIDNN